MACYIKLYNYIKYDHTKLFNKFMMIIVMPTVVSINFQESNKLKCATNYFFNQY